MYVIMDQLTSRANLSDPEEFRTIAQYLEGKGWIAELTMTTGFSSSPSKA